jgi:hypothetical protein
VVGGGVFINRGEGGTCVFNNENRNARSDLNFVIVL